MHVRFVLLASAMIGCVGGGKRPVVLANPQAGDPSDVAEPGQSACEAATRTWPASPALDAEILSAMADGHLLGVAACIVKDGDVVWCNGYGSTRVSGGRPVTADTPFLLASVSKLVTATSVGVLVDRGALSWDAPVEDALPFSVAHPRSSAAITTRRTLAHVGGIDDNGMVMEGWYSAGRDPVIPLMELNEAYFDPSGGFYDPWLNFTRGGPEEQFRYSNMGYALLGALVEETAGQDFAEWSKETFFQALGMNNTSWRVEDFSAEVLAEPTSYTHGAWVGHGDMTFADYPNGALRSSANDMGCWLAAFARGGTLYGTEVLPRELVLEMMQPQFPRIDERQGLGWYYEDMGEAAPWVGHSGAESGVATDVFMRPDGSLGVVLLANSDWDNQGYLGDIEDALIAFGRSL